MPRAADRKRAWLLGASAAVLAAVLAASPAAMAQPDAPAGPGVVAHVVRPGEWVFSIARKYGVPGQAIIVLNHLAPPYVIRPGQKLLIPSGPEHPPATTATANPPVSVGQPSPTPSQAQLTPKPAPSPPPQPAPTQTPIPATGQPAAPPAVHAGPRVTAGTGSSTLHPTHTITVVLPLKDQQVYLGDVEATITPDGTVSLNTAQVLDVLGKSLSVKAMDALKAAIGAQPKVELAALAAAGFPATYDPAQLQIVLNISGAARPINTLDVAQLDQTQLGQLVKPQGFSGYLNLHGSFDAVEQGSGRGVTDPLVLLDGALRLNGVVLTGEATMGPGTSVGGATTGETLTRQGTRFVFDDIKHTWRWTLGDLQSQAQGFQGGVDISGVSLVRLYTVLAPQLNVRPRGERSFTLERSSTVETIINGRVIQSVRLDAGTYDFHNFPFVDGANNVQILITDDTGQRETLNFSIFFDRTLLAPGLTEFGIWAGVKNYEVNGDLRYTDQPALTAFVRHGFSDRLTLGANLQADQHGMVLGGQWVWGTVLGTVGGDAAYSYNTYVGSGYALNVGFSRLQQSANQYKSQSMTVSLQTRSPNFAPLASATSANSNDSAQFITVTGKPNPSLNPYALQVALSYGRSFSQYVYANLDANYSLGRNGNADVASVVGSVGYRLGPQTDITVDVEYQHSASLSGPGVRLSLTHRFGQTRNIRASYDSEGGNQATLSYQDSGGRGVGSWSLSGDVNYASTATGVDASATYEANRGDIGIAQTASWDLTGSHVQDQRTSFRFDTAIAFAGDTFAIGRPIYDSFAVFKAHPSLGSAQVVVDPSDQGDLANSGALGPALLADLGSYSVRTIVYDVPKAPQGYDIGQGSVLVVPPYRSGYRIVVGSDYSVTVIGRLIDAQGAPITLLAGKAVDLDNPQHPPVELFTSRDGRFGAEGLRPGHWRIEMPTQPESDFVITVPKGATGLYRAGDLRPNGN